MVVAIISALFLVAPVKNAHAFNMNRTLYAYLDPDSFIFDSSGYCSKTEYLPKTGDTFSIGNKKSIGKDGITTFDICIIKKGANHDVLWTKTLGGSENDIVLGTWETWDEKYYLIVGTTNSSGNGSYDVYFAKVDAGGNLLWSKTYGGAGFDAGCVVYPASDGGYLLGGFTDSFGNGSRKAYVIKTDSTGNLQWNGASGDEGISEYNDARQLSDGGYILAGSTNSYDAGKTDALLTKLDASGNIVWSRAYGGKDNLTGDMVYDDSDSKALYHMSVTRETDYSSVYVNVDANGNIVGVADCTNKPYDYPVTITHSEAYQGQTSGASIISTQADGQGTGIPAWVIPVAMVILAVFLIVLVLLVYIVFIKKP